MTVGREVDEAVEKDGVAEAAAAQLAGRGEQRRGVIGVGDRQQGGDVAPGGRLPVEGAREDLR